MPKPRKHRVVLYIKDSNRAIGIIDRLWAVGELTTEQRVAMVSKIDDKRIEIENKKKEKLENLLARASITKRKPIQICAQANMPSETLAACFRQFYKNTGTNTKKRKGCHVEQR